MKHQRAGLGFITWAAIVLAAAVSAEAQSGADLKITRLIPSQQGYTLDWESGAAGTAYSVLFQDTLQDGIWRLPPSPVPFPLDANEWVDPSTEIPSRFYRIIGVPAAQRGKLLSSKLTRTLSKLELTLAFAAAGIPLTPQYSVRMYKVSYETIDPWGARTTASGAILLPENTGKALPLVSYQHGTIILTNEAPSSMDLNTEVSVGVAFASIGYAAAAPDYLGLGSSPGLHPYHHARSEATACVDMLRATKSLCSNKGFALKNRLFLCGYSQGGHATMAFLRELETYHTNEFTVTACAPMAGAYDLSGVTATDFLSGRPEPNPYYFAYLLAAYEDVYHFAPSLAAILAPPYDSTLPPMLGGNVSSDDINKAMPASPSEVLKPEFLDDFKNNPRNPLRLALEDNDVYDWKPRAPMRMYHCAGDRDVVIANSEVAYASFQALGATQVELIDPKPSGDHAGCVLPSFLAVKSWFNSLK